MEFRRHVLTPSRLNYLIALLPRIAAHDKYRLVEGNGEDDPIHHRYGSQFWGNHSGTLWNSGYFAASTGGVSLEVLKP